MSRSSDVGQVFERSPEDYSAMFSRIFDRLSVGAEPMCKQAGIDDCAFSVALVDGDTVNAFAGENQTIFLFSGLLRLLKTEEEVAAIVAHEAGHHIANHIAETKQNAEVGAAAMSFLAGGLVGLLVYSQGGMDGTPAANYGEALGAGAYSKEQETEADLLAVYLLERSGYDAEAAERVWRVFYSMNQEVADSWSDTHPSDVQRLAHWRKAIAEARSSTNALPRKD